MPDQPKFNITAFHMEGKALPWFQALHDSNGLSTWCEFLAKFDQKWQQVVPEKIETQEKLKEVAEECDQQIQESKSANMLNETDLVEETDPVETIPQSVEYEELPPNGLGLIIPESVVVQIFQDGDWFCQGEVKMFDTKLNRKFAFFPWCGCWSFDPGKKTLFLEYMNLEFFKERLNLLAFDKEDFKFFKVGSENDVMVDSLGWLSFSVFHYGKKNLEWAENQTLTGKTKQEVVIEEKVFDELEDMGARFLKLVMFDLWHRCWKDRHRDLQEIDVQKASSKLCFSVPDRSFLQLPGQVEWCIPKFIGMVNSVYFLGCSYLVFDPGGGDELQALGRQSEGEAIQFSFGLPGSLCVTVLKVTKGIVPLSQLCWCCACVKQLTI